jgi:abequosyltransferase
LDKIKLTICMPTRNRAGFIGQALESVISQADESVEIVIIDGASQDNTPDVVQRYQQRFKNLLYCRQEKNGGVDRDMAKAITLARGEYCWLLSDDDALKPGAIKRILQEIKSGYELFLCNITICDLSLRPIRERFWLSRDVEDSVFNLHDKSELVQYCNKANSIGALFSFWSSIILRREVWVRSGYDKDFDKSAYALAATLISSFSKTFRLKYIKRPLVLWRSDNESFQNEGGLVKRFLLDFDGYLHIADKYLSFDSAVRVSFLRVMKREHPWYTIINVASHIDSLDLWAQFKNKLFKFGYSPRMIEICYLLGKYRNIVSFAVKIKRKIVKSFWINNIVDWLHSRCKQGCKRIMQITPVFNYLLIFNIFSGAFCIFRQPFEFYLGYIFIIVFLAAYMIRYRSVAVNAKFLILLMIFTVTSFVNVYLGNDTFFLVAKQVLGILVTGAAYYLLVIINNYDINKLFKIYLRIALVIAAIGIFQEISYVLKFRIGYDYNWMWMIRKWTVVSADKIGLLRVNSIFYEPSHFAVSMAPAFFASFFYFLTRNNGRLISKLGSLVIISSYILTFSLVAYIAIFISIILVTRFKGLRYLIVTLIIMPISAFGAYILLPDIRMRINDAIAFFSHPSVNPATHMSVYSIVSNTFIAFKSFMVNPILGLGLGSHPVSYDKFLSIGVSNGFMLNNYPEVSKGDAGGLLLRLFSETGLLGIIAVFYFIFKFRLRLKDQSNLTIVSNAILVLFILQLLRQGHYFYNGTFFFVWVYYFANRIYSSKNGVKKY